MTTPQQEFLAHRRGQEAQTVANTRDPNNPLGSLLTVELNTTELCNRKCVFCPRVDPGVYPNRSLHLSVQLGKARHRTPKFIIESDASIVAPLIFGWLLEW